MVANNEIVRRAPRLQTLHAACAREVLGYVVALQSEPTPHCSGGAKQPVNWLNVHNIGTQLIQRVPFRTKYGVSDF